MVLEPIKNVGSIPKQTIQASPKEMRNNIDTKEVNADESGRPADGAEATKIDLQVGGGSIPSDRQQSQEQIKKALEQIHKGVPNSEAVFSIHDGTNRVTIKIIDKETKEVLKEYPPEKTLDMITKIWELAGMMVDEKR